MDWIQSVQRALNYIESNLLDNELDNETVANQVYSSNANFQRIFSIVTGVTIGDYIRYRRLSLASQEFLKSELKIIDVAMKYGYDTPESFSKAFVRFHGVNPSDARKHSNLLKHYHPIKINITIQGGFGMVRKLVENLPLDIPFSGFCSTTFINCFSTVYLFLEAPQCNATLNDIQQRYFMLFDTMCGRSSLRCTFTGEQTEMEKMICETDFYDGGTDNNIDFLFGFAGYDYQKLDEPAGFKSAVAASIDANRPVIAKVKEGKARFRIIVGYETDNLISPHYQNAQDKPKESPMYDDIETLYVIGDKIKPSHTLRDGLMRIKTIMEYNLNERLWDEYKANFKYWGGGLEKESNDEIKHRFKRVAQTMWHTFNCSNFAEAFRHNVYEEMRDPALLDSWQRISFAYDDTHNRAWSIIHLESVLDWSKRPEWGICEIIPLLIEAMKQNDIVVLEVINNALKILHQKRDMKPVLIKC